MKFCENFKKLICKYILRKKYYRYGNCAKCGACCRNIYVRHKNSVIKSEEEFEAIKSSCNYSFYKHIKIIGKDEFGLIFCCLKYDEDKKICKDHKHRPSICRNYPSEEIFSFGAQLNDECGYSFEPIVKFSEILNKTLKKPVKDFELFND